MISQFHDEWLGIEKIEAMIKDPKAFPGYSPAIAAAMREEVRHFVDDVVWKGDAKVGTLLSARYTYLNKTLGDFYGVTGLGDAFEKVDETKLGNRPAAGLLTMGALLALKSSSTDTSPTLRGVFVRTALFCQVPPPPPENAIFMAPASKPDQTRRELIESHATNPACSTCHKLMDPIGLALENFDAVGRFRDTESGKSIDVTVDLVFTDVDGKVTGPSELSTKISASKQVSSCVATHWFQNAFGRDPGTGDKPVLTELIGHLESRGYFAAIKYITQTPQFRFRSLPEGAQP